MKIFYLSAILSLFIGFSNSILAQPCAAGTATETLDAANSTITLSSSGLWAFDPNGSTPAYEWPKTATGQGPGLIFTGNLWFGGFDDGGNLKLAAKTYGLDDNNGYWPGPYNADFSTPNAEVCTNWDRLFKVNGSEIEAFRVDFEDNQQINDPIPNSILGWPGHGNPSFSSVHGFELPELEGGLAPFFDQNFDGIYDPLAGDYPLIKCADQAVWWVFNDSGNINSSNSNNISLEVQMLAYVYNSNESNINNSSFYDVKFINRGTEPMDSMYAGIWIDTDLGCPFDDYLGNAPDENLVYFYNEDEIDGEADGTCEGIPTYEEAPMFGIKLLEGPLNSDGSSRLNMTSSLYYDNQSGSPTGSQAPSMGYEFYNLLTGNRTDGSEFLNPNNGPTHFLFSDNPAITPDGWSMCSEQLTSADRRSITSIGPMKLNPGQSNNMTFAVVVQPQPALPCPDVSALIAAADMPVPTNTISNSFCNLTVGVNEETVERIGLSVFPNPATDLINFQLSENESFATVHLYRMDGQLVRKLDNLQSSNVTFTREDLASGTYIYQIITQDAAAASGKIILK